MDKGTEKYYKAIFAGDYDLDSKTILKVMRETEEQIGGEEDMDFDYWEELVREELEKLESGDTELDAEDLAGVSKEWLTNALYYGEKHNSDVLAKGNPNPSDIDLDYEFQIETLTDLYSASLDNIMKLPEEDRDSTLFSIGRIIEAVFHSGYIAGLQEDISYEQYLENAAEEEKKVWK